MDKTVRLLNGPNIRQIKAYAIVNISIFCCAALVQNFLVSLDESHSLTISLRQHLGYFLLLQPLHAALIFKQMIVFSGFLGWASIDSNRSLEAYVYASYGVMFPLAGAILMSAPINSPNLFLSGVALAYTLPMLHTKICRQFY
jgi:hypothetical protein